MHFTKIIYRIGILICFLFLLSTCKKQNLFGVKIKAVKSPFGEGIEGIAYKIIEIKEKFSLNSDLFGGNNLKYKTIKFGILEKSSDYQIIPFYGLNRGKYTYMIQFDFSALPDEYSNYKSSLGGAMLDEAFCNETNTFEIYFQKEIKNLILHYKNMNCFDENDEFKYKQISLMDKNEFKDLNTLTWTVSQNLQGCADYSTPPGLSKSGISVFQWEAKKNNIITSDIDTFYNFKDSLILEIFW
ncbi:MAG: hypothetical protein HYU67_12155 [Flavobacteriia bacterium]|nr:hypothetical protein [Flavobacteriia bacterium]